MSKKDRVVIQTILNIAERETNRHIVEDWGSDNFKDELLLGRIRDYRKEVQE